MARTRRHKRKKTKTTDGTDCSRRRSARISTSSNEILTMIFEKLDPPATVCFALTCKHLKSMFDDISGYGANGYFAFVDDTHSECNCFMCDRPEYIPPKDAKGIIQKINRWSNEKMPVLKLDSTPSEALYTYGGEGLFLSEVQVGLYLQLQKSPYLANFLQDPCMARYHHKLKYEVPFLENACRICDRFFDNTTEAKKRVFLEKCFYIGFRMRYGDAERYEELAPYIYGGLEANLDPDRSWIERVQEGHLSHRDPVHFDLNYLMKEAIFGIEP